MSDQSQMGSSSYQESSQSASEYLQVEEERIKQQLKEMPYEYILKHYQQSRKGQKQAIQTKKKIKKPRVDIQNEDKTAPKEIRIMRAPPKKQIKQIFTNQRPKTIDPRFEDYAGSYNADLAKKSFAFIPQMQKREVEELKKSIRKKKVKEEEREVLLKNYNKVTSDIRRNEIQEIEKEVKQNLKKNKNFIPKKKVFKQEVEKVKLKRMDKNQQERYIKKKNKKIQKKRIIERKAAFQK